ncbi:hypothetical protein NMQ01_10000 [Janibacter sp. CX7]|uniref:hypothetical protein n=1 Tax=Janibacter sp. CX7 TaxID=2963431 RepID=UPI0020CF67A6|nr:hypothetical protein [Janibacter sp. CX7]UTT65056.1 hypothetical protein NMQ01_10000 [Janibacter sp. CX7]
MGTPRHLTAAMAALLTLGLVGCTDDSPDKDGTGTSTKDGSRTTVEMTEVKGTEALRPETTVVGGWTTVVSGKRSAVIAELTGSDGKPTQVYAVDPQTRSRTALDVTAPIDWEQAANDKAAVVAGDVSTDHKRTPFVRVSSDLKTWRDVPISYPDAGWSFSEVGLDGDDPLVIAEKPDGSEVLMRRDGNDWSVHDIPAAKRQEISPIGLVEHRAELVLLASEGKRGGESVTRVLTSADGGKTWDRGPQLPGPKGSYGIAGVVSTGTHLVATGWADRKAPIGTSGMVWSSGDGRSWSRQRTTPISWADNVPVTEDFHLSAPSLVGGRAVFDQTCDSCTWTTRHEMSGAGKPEVTDNQKQIEAAGPDTAQLPGRSAGIRQEHGTLRIFDGGRVRDLIRGEIPGEVQPVEKVGDTVLVPVGRFTFTAEDGDNQWHTMTKTTPFVIDGRLKKQEWRPKALGQWSDLATASDPRGRTTVAAGTRYDKDFSAATMAETNGSWTSGSGLGRFWYESALGVEWAGDAFRLRLEIEEEETNTRHRQARLYSSTDGASWTPDRGDWTRHPDSASAIESVCELPDGTPFAVGSSQSDPNAESDATTWTHRDGRWNIDVPRLGGEGASIYSCATTGDVTVVSGSVDGDGTEWTTKDGKTFTAGDHLPRGRYRGVPVEADGGLVAPGWLDTAEHTGPVVWFTRDGKAWQWAALDMADASSSVQVRAAGEDVYAVVSQASGDRIWTIDEIATTKVTGDEG